VRETDEAEAVAHALLDENDTAAWLQEHKLEFGRRSTMASNNDSSSATGKTPGKGEKGCGVSPEVDGELGWARKNSGGRCHGEVRCCYSLQRRGCSEEEQKASNETEKGEERRRQKGVGVLGLEHRYWGFYRGKR
jgi:hypothetical protein